MLPFKFFAEAAEEIEKERRFYRERSKSAEGRFLTELGHAVATVSEAAHR